jgi:N-acetylmuramoyl-L-alanine amidase
VAYLVSEGMMQGTAILKRGLNRWGFFAVILLGVFSSLGFQPGNAFAAPVPTVTDIRVGQIDGATRLVLDIDRSIKFKVFLLSGPDRVVIDLPAVGWRLPQRPLPQNVGLLGKLRYGLFKPGVTRVVIEVRKPVKIADVLLLKPIAKHSHRVVLDLKNVSRKTFAKLVKQQALVVSGPGSRFGAQGNVQQPRQGMLVPPSKSSRQSQKSQQSQRGVASKKFAQSPFMLPPRKPKISKRRKRIIVLDPGHGGADPGAVSLKGIYEKHITLAAAREFKVQLEKTGRYKVLLTRVRDVFIKLRERVEFARDAKADLFISLHADKIKNSKIRGLSVHTLSEKASDREAAELADRENKVDLIVGVDLSHESKDVTNILIDLAQRETMNQSARFATLLVSELKRKTKLLRNTHRFAGFAVLKAPDVPSVLLEMGFLSNRYDERNLRRKSYRARLAKSVVRAVDRYFARVEQANR